MSRTIPNENRRHYLMKLSSYVLALRPWSFSTSLMPVLLGSTLAYKFTGIFDLTTLVITAITTLLIHAAGNVVNTYYDWQKGIDNEGSSDRTLVDAILSIEEVGSLGVFLYAVGLVGFSILVKISPAQMEHLALVHFCGLSSSFLYTGGIGFKYIALGDLIVLIFFGPFTVVYSYLAQTGDVSFCEIQ